MADLEKPILAQNWKATFEYAHKIKPTFYYVGREDARDHMQEIESNARDNKDTALIPDAFAEAKRFIVILYKQLDDAKALLKQKL